jgi:hypothetical protein
MAYRFVDLIAIAEVNLKLNDYQNIITLLDLAEKDERQCGHSQ